MLYDMSYAVCEGTKGPNITKNADVSRGTTI